MGGIELWSTTAGSNNSAPPNGSPEGCAPSTVNDTMRNMMAAVRTWYESAQWINLGNTPTYISATSFSVTGDQTAIYTVGRRIRVVGTTPFTLYGTILTSVFGSVTTITLKLDSGSMDSTLSAVSVSIFTTSNLALPRSTPNYATTTGSANTYIASLTPKLAAHKIGLPITVIANFSNTDAALINFDGLGDASIKKDYNQALIQNDILSGEAFTVIYDGTNYQLQNRAGNLNLIDNLLQRAEIKDYSETKSDVVAASTTVLDIENGNIFNMSQDTNISTFTWSNPSATGKGCSFTLIRTKDNTGTSRTIAWPASVKWGGGLAPTLTQSANAVDIFSFFTMNAGTTWYGFVAGQGMA